MTMDVGYCTGAHPDNEPKPGYHIRKIPKGVLGLSSKIREEFEEFIDAEKQGVKVMTLVELSDLVGAIEAYLANKFPGVSLGDLHQMAEVTRRAFNNGVRQARPVEPSPSPKVDPFVHPADKVCGNGCYYEVGHSSRCSDDPAHP